MGRTVRVSEICEIRIAESVQEVECVRSLPAPRPFVECLPAAEGVAAIRSTSPGEAPLNHGELRDFIASAGNLHSRGIGPKDVVAVVMPNGPELAVALLTCMCQCIAAPLEPSMSKAEFEAAFGQLGVSHVIALREHKVYDSSLTEACASMQCSLHYAVRLGKKAGVFAWTEPVPGGAAFVPPLSEDAGPTWTQAHDTVLLLRTSGTTSKPKVVPLTAHGLYTGAMCIGRGLGLTSEDASLNIMPLTHIGGISCSLLASIFTGGAVICGPVFDPGSFIEWLDAMGPTWYYAAPTIHKAVIIFAAALPNSPKHRLRFIRSGAANLADVDARDLRQLFGCTVLPTYSMSECMPVAQPLWDYDLGKPGTVGVPIASSLRVVNEEGMALPRGIIGEVCIKGPVVTRGYLNNEDANEWCFFGELDAEGCRWFRTGDVGHLDADGYLFLTGRNKELIKRGGDQVSPYEVEEALLKHPGVEIAVVFGVPNDFWGEEVAAAVVLKPGFHPEADSSTVALPAPENDRRSLSFTVESGPLVRSFSNGGSVSLARLREFLKPLLADNKIPQQVKFVDAAESLPKTRTGKYLRVGLAAHLGLSAVDVAAEQGLQRVALGPPAVAPPVKPDKSIYGVRYFVACWVMFIHIARMPPAVAAWRGFSPSMPAFFTLAGFLLCSSMTRPITKLSDLWNFYKNRIVAAHPLYIVSVLFVLPLTFMICTPNPDNSPDAITYTEFDYQGQQIILPYHKGALLGPAETVQCPADMHRGEAGPYTGYIMGMLVNLFFAQLAFWPWGLKYLTGGFFNGVLWFTSVYYTCLLLFPFLHLLSRRLYCGFLCNPRKYLVRPLLIRYTVVLVSWWLAWTFVTKAFFAFFPDFVAKHSDNTQGGGTQAFFAAYCCPLIWVGEFFMGILMFNAFEMNRRGSNLYLWPHWGVMTDCLTILLLSVLPAVSMMRIATTMESVSLETRESIGHLLGHLSDVYNGEATMRLCTLLLCPWIYGLATGQGCAARFLGSGFLVKYCGPASYSMYLFHYPIATYWILVFHPVYNWTPQQFHDLGTDALDPIQGFLRWYDYFGVLATTTLVALFCTHVLNTRLTAGFLRIVDFLCLPCCGRRGGEEETTLIVIARAIQGLTGAEVDASTPLMECGLDSFGTGALVGILRPSFPNMRLTAIEVYNLGTVGALAAAIDEEDAGCARQGQARDVRNNPSHQPLV